MQKLLYGMDQCGLFEFDKFAIGTNEIAKTLSEMTNSITIIGGGDSAAAVEKAGLTPDMSVSDLCEGMKTAMTEVTVEGLTGTITWTADGEPSKDPKAVVITDGAYKAM